MKISGGCHCGAVRFSFDTESRPELLDCNCSICSKSAYLHLFVPHDDFVLEGSWDAIKSYRFGSGQAAHLFCKTCGVKSFYQPRSHPDCWSVNYRCLDAGHEIKPEITQFDGRDWSAAHAALK